VNDSKSSSFYFGKRVAYIYRSTNKDAKYKVSFLKKCLWGKVAKSHGDNGVVIARFR
jgi:large subunit ribosomal protein L35Ae